MSLTEHTTDIDAVRSSLPPSANYVLEVLHRKDGVARRDGLLEETHLAEATVDRALGQLEDYGLIRRDRDGDDLRYVHIEVSEKS